MSSIQRGWLSSRLAARSDILDLRTKYILSKADKRNPHLNCRFRKKRQVRKDEDMQVTGTPRRCHPARLTRSGHPASTGQARSPWSCLPGVGRGYCWEGKGHTGLLWGWGGLCDSSGFYGSALKAVSLFPLSGHPLTKGRGKKTELKSRGNIFRKVESTK